MSMEGLRNWKKKKSSVTGTQARAGKNEAERTGRGQIKERLVGKESELQPEGNRKPKRTFEQQTEMGRFYLGKDCPDE